jgi:hypothetical protein
MAKNAPGADRPVSGWFPMSVFQDSLLVSEVPDWVDMLQTVHSPKPGEVITRLDLESDPASELKPEKGGDTSLAP